MVLCLLVLATYLFSDPAVRWLVGLPIFLAVLAAYIYITITHFRRERHFLENLRVDLTSKDLRLHLDGRSPLSVEGRDVFSVEETYEGLAIATYDYRKLTIPSGLAGDGDDQVRDMLTGYTWIRPIPAYRYLPDLPLFVGLTVALVVLVMVNTLYSALFVGGGLLLYFTIVYLRVRWVFHIDPQVFRSYTLALSFMMFIIIMKTCILIPIHQMGP